VFNYRLTELGSEGVKELLNVTYKCGEAIVEVKVGRRDRPEIVGKKTFKS